MSRPKVTVSLLTRNRPQLLRLALDSILAQEGVELEVLVLDNASSDNTPEVVRSYTDPRVIDLRSETDMGMARNWNRGYELAAARSPFVCLFHDDDLMLPGFLVELIAALEANPSAGFATCLPQFIAQDGTLLHPLNTNDVPDGLIHGLDYMELAVNRREMNIYPPTVVFRSEILRRLGPIDSPHIHASMDMNLYYRAIMISDFFFLRKVLSHCRQHAGSETDAMYRESEAIFRYGAAAELIDVAIYLMQTPRANDPKYRKWLAERMSALHVEASQSLRPLSPRTYHPFEVRRAMIIDQILRTIPPEQPFILVDDQQLGITDPVEGRKVLPFIERDGEYWGLPNDDQFHSVEELERMRRDGLRWLVIAWPSFWWLEFYRRFRERLQQNYRQASKSPQAIVFDLT